MKRSTLGALLLVMGALLPDPACACGAAVDPMRVAFVSDGLNGMDLAGPREVCQDVMLPGAAPGADVQMPFELYTVATTGGQVTIAGGATVVPRSHLAAAPRPDIVVIGAQSDNSPELLTWLAAQHVARVTVMSVCNGARKLALAGVLDGKVATSHTEFLAEFAEPFPQVQPRTARRFERAVGTTHIAGGLPSGIDLALHLMAARFDVATAQATTDFMAYRGTGWKEPD